MPARDSTALLESPIPTNVSTAPRHSTVTNAKLESPIPLVSSDAGAAIGRGVGRDEGLGADAEGVGLGLREARAFAADLVAATAGGGGGGGGGGVGGGGGGRGGAMIDVNLKLAPLSASTEGGGRVARYHRLLITGLLITSHLLPIIYDLSLITYHLLLITDDLLPITDYLLVTYY